MALYVYRGGKKIKRNGNQVVPIDRIDACRCLNEVAACLFYPDTEAYLLACDVSPQQVRQRLDTFTSREETTP